VFSMAVVLFFFVLFCGVPSLFVVLGLHLRWFVRWWWSLLGGWVCSVSGCARSVLVHLDGSVWFALEVGCSVVIRWWVLFGLMVVFATGVAVRDCLCARLGGWTFGLCYCVMVSKTRKGMVLLTRKGLVTNVLDSSLDLSSHALFDTHCVWWTG
jgi:hypothetical protein